MARRTKHQHPLTGQTGSRSQRPSASPRGKGGTAVACVLPIASAHGWRVSATSSSYKALPAHPSYMMDDRGNSRRAKSLAPTFLASQSRTWHRTSRAAHVRPAPQGGEGGPSRCPPHRAHSRGVAPPSLATRAPLLDARERGALGKKRVGAPQEGARHHRLCPLIVCWRRHCGHPQPVGELRPSVQHIQCGRPPPSSAGQSSWAGKNSPTTPAPGHPPALHGRLRHWQEPLLPTISRRAPVSEVQTSVAGAGASGQRPAAPGRRALPPPPPPWPQGWRRPSAHTRVLGKGPPAPYPALPPPPPPTGTGPPRPPASP